MMVEKKRAMNLRSLMVTLAVAFLALSAVVLVISNALNIYFTYEIQQEAIASQQQMIANDAADAVKGFIQEKFGMLETTAGVGNLIEDQENQKMVLDKLLGLEHSFRQLVLLNAQEKELARVSRLSGIISVQLTEANVSELFYKVRRGETYISQVYIDEVTSEPMTIIAVPVTDVFGDFKGALMAEVNLKFMWDLVGGLKIGDKGVAYVVDKKGNLIAFGDTSRVLRGENLACLEEVNEFVNGDELAHESSADVSTGIRGTQVVANHARLVNPDWAVVVELPAEDAYETVNMAIRLALLVILLSFILTVLAGIYLSRRITRPIISLRDAAAEIGKGKLDTIIEARSKNEIGELASAFNSMTSDLRKSKKELEKYSKELEKKVKERTAELEKSKKDLEAKNVDLERFNKLAVGRELKMVDLKKRIRELENKA
jgi:methyl-accepting chemotaxis protein